METLTDEEVISVYSGAITTQRSEFALHKYMCWRVKWKYRLNPNHGGNPKRCGNKVGMAIKFLVHLAEK